MYIYQSARKLGKKTHGLETFKESMDFLKQAEKESQENPQNYSQTDYQSRMDAQTETHCPYGKQPTMLGHKRVPHLASLAKYAVAFFRMSRSSVTRASSRFRRRISATCSSSPEPAGFESFFFLA